MVTERISLIGILIASMASAVGTLAQQDWITISAASTTLGLAGISLYQKFREEKRKQDKADLDLQAASLQSIISSQNQEIASLTSKLGTMTDEAHRWLRLYRELKGDTPKTTGNGP